jgi:hypothetical protein
MGVGREDERDDDELLLAAAQGDGVAFGAFYERHLAAVLAFARRRSAGAEETHPRIATGSAVKTGVPRATGGCVNQV